MRIAPHHIPGTPEHRLSTLLRPDPAYTPVCAWPDNCMVQWGHGIIPAVPFFEAFLPGTFIRGEGVTIADAERKAFAQFESEFLCSHVWGRHSATRGAYLNGAAWCRKCGAFLSAKFPALRPSGWWRKPLSRTEADWLASLENDHELNAIMDRKYPADIASRQKSQRMLRLRLNVFGLDDTASSSPYSEIG